MACHYMVLRGVALHCMVFGVAKRYSTRHGVTWHYVSLNVMVLCGELRNVCWGCQVRTITKLDSDEQKNKHGHLLQHHSLHATMSAC